MPRTLYDRFTPPAIVVDSALAMLLLVPAVGELVALPTSSRYSLVMILPIALRRVAPVVSFAAIAAIAALQLRLVPSPIYGDLVMIIAVASIARYGPTWARWSGLATGLIGSVLGPIQWEGGLHAIHHRTQLYPIGLAAVTVVAAWIFGDLRRTRERYIAELEDRADRLTRERDQQAEIASSAERARIAREMHDVVAHSLSVIVVQADGGRYAAEQDPTMAGRVLQTIAVTGRRALADMRQLLGILREGESDLSPQPGSEDVADLVRQVVASGLEIALSIDGDSARLDRAAGLTLYRIVQEALTNTIKHGGPGARATVSISYGPAAATVTICDDGRGGAAAPTNPGHGLVGMRERVELHGGTLVAEPRAGGGFGVRARLPYLKEAV